jgi:hypothetical protein
VVIFVILLVFMFKVMAGSSVPVLGSPGALWDLLQPDVLTTKAYGAKDGSYLTMDSGGTYFSPWITERLRKLLIRSMIIEGLILAGVILVSGFGSVFVDPSVTNPV